MPTYYIIIMCVVVAWIIFASLIALITTMNASRISAEERRKELERLLFECEESKNGGSSER